MSQPTPSLRLPLCQLPAGTVGRICELTGDAQFCQRVREMGFGESACVTKISGTVTVASILGSLDFVMGECDR